MNNEQIANFVYWIMETYDHRGAKEFEGKDRITFIRTLIPVFMAKYPDCILTGWTNAVIPNFTLNGDMANQFNEMQEEDYWDGDDSYSM